MKNIYRQCSLKWIAFGCGAPTTQSTPAAAAAVPADSNNKSSFYRSKLLLSPGLKHLVDACNYDLNGTAQHAATKCWPPLTIGQADLKYA